MNKIRANKIPSSLEELPKHYYSISLFIRLSIIYDIFMAITTFYLTLINPSINIDWVSYLIVLIIVGLILTFPAVFDIPFLIVLSSFFGGYLTLTLFSDYFHLIWVFHLIAFPIMGFYGFYASGCRLMKVGLRDLQEFMMSNRVKEINVKNWAFMQYILSFEKFSKKERLEKIMKKAMRHGYLKRNFRWIPEDQVIIYDQVFIYESH